MRWNDETAFCLAVAAAYLAVLIYSIRKKSARPALWMIRATLLAFVLFHTAQLVKHWRNDFGGGVEEAMAFLIVTVPLFGISLLRLPKWLIWVTYALFCAMALFVLWFAAFFTVPMM